MTLRRSLLSILLAVAVSTAAGGLEVDNLELHIWLTTTREAGPPVEMDGTLVFRYSTAGPVRHVGISFQHESFSRIHSFVRNSHGVYLYPLKAPRSATQISYRIVVDGLWMLDPFNPRRVEDSLGNHLSVVPVQTIHRESLRSPVLHDDGTVEFTFSHAGDERVYLSGTFNRWDPFMYRLRQVSPNTFSIRLPLSSGRYLYHFVVAGRRIADPRNPYSAAEPSGRIVSELVVP